MFPTVNHFQTFKAGSVNSTVTLDTDEATNLQMFLRFDVENF